MSDFEFDAHIPDGPLAEKWDQHKFSVKLVNPSNRRKFHVIVVGRGLAGASAAATLGELGYQVTMITFHDTPRRAHSIAAQKARGGRLVHPWAVVLCLAARGEDENDR